MNIKKLIREEIVKIFKELNEALPANDPILKKLRTQIPGEKFPELKTWWEYEPEDIMTYVYWHQGLLPPTGPKFEKEWNNIVKQLHRNYPIPAEELDRVLPKMDLDDRTEREISVDAPSLGETTKTYKKKVAEAETNIAGQTKPFQPGDMWSNDFDYTGMLKFGASATMEMGYEVLTALYDSFTDVNYHTEAADLGNALEWIEDAKGIEDEEKAREFMEMFREACMKTLKKWGVKYKPEGN